VTLKAVLLHYSIRKSKPDNFETLMNDIDGHFREGGVQLPYRRDIWNLNDTRNLAQHDAREPATSTMDEWKVFTEKFLRRSFEQYFGLRFDEVTQIDLIEDETLRNLLRLAVQCAENGSAKESLVLAAFAVEFAISSCIAAPLIPAYGLTMGSVSEENDARDAIDTLNEELYNLINDVYVLGDVVKDIASSVDLLARGVSLTDYGRFIAITPDISFDRLSAARVQDSSRPLGRIRSIDPDGTIQLDESPEQPRADEHQPEHRVVWAGRSADQEAARWAAQFATSTVVQLQDADPSPHMPSRHAAFAQELIRTKGEVASSDEPASSRQGSDSDTRHHRRRFLRRTLARVAISPEMDEPDDEA
jgi:hypothetical protein